MFLSFSFIKLHETLLSLKYRKSRSSLRDDNMTSKLTLDTAHSDTTLLLLFMTKPKLSSKFVQLEIRQTDY